MSVPMVPLTASKVRMTTKVCVLRTQMMQGMGYVPRGWREGGAGGGSARVKRLEMGKGGVSGWGFFF